MASPAQISANRRNAANSTGPKTVEGKAVASRNAQRHSLRAEQVILFDEQAKDFARLRDDLRAVLDPADAVEEEIVERIVLCAWRLRRAWRAEAGVINNSAEEFRKHEIEPQLGGAFYRVLAEVVVLSRYEAALDRSLRRAHAQLERRQARRRGETGVVPIAIDLDGLEEIVVGAALPGKNENGRTKPILESADDVGDKSHGPL